MSNRYIPLLIYVQDMELHIMSHSINIYNMYPMSYIILDIILHIYPRCWRNESATCSWKQRSSTTPSCSTMPSIFTLGSRAEKSARAMRPSKRSAASLRLKLSSSHMHQRHTYKLDGMDLYHRYAQNTSIYFILYTDIHRCTCNPVNRIDRHLN